MGVENKERNNQSVWQRNSPNLRWSYQGNFLSYTVECVEAENADFVQTDNATEPEDPDFVSISWTGIQ